MHVSIIVSSCLYLCHLVDLFSFPSLQGVPVVANRVVRISSFKERDILADAHFRNTSSCGPVAKARDPPHDGQFEFWCGQVSERTTKTNNYYLTVKRVYKTTKKNRYRKSSCKEQDI